MKSLQKLLQTEHHQETTSTSIIKKNQTSSSDEQQTTTEAGQNGHLMGQNKHWNKPTKENKRHKLKHNLSDFLKQKRTRLLPQKCKSYVQ